MLQKMGNAGRGGNGFSVYRKLSVNRTEIREIIGDLPGKTGFGNHQDLQAVWQFFGNQFLTEGRIHSFFHYCTPCKKYVVSKRSVFAASATRSASTAAILSIYSAGVIFIPLKAAVA